MEKKILTLIIGAGMLFAAAAIVLTASPAVAHHVPDVVQTEEEQLAPFADFIPTTPVIIPAMCYRADAVVDFAERFSKGEIVTFDDLDAWGNSGFGQHCDVFGQAQAISDLVPIETFRTSSGELRSIYRVYHPAMGFGYWYGEAPGADA